MTGHASMGRRGAGFAAVALATAGLFLASRGKWSDAIIDSGREWIVPDALARGDMLYRDVVYWFGPFTPYFHAGLFWIFGSSFRTLVLAGCLGAAGVLWCLFYALTRVTDRLAAGLWTALAVPALVFMPNAGGAILGMGYRIWHAAAFSLLSVAVASSPSRRRLAAAGAGALCALTGLCRLEWGLAALSAAALVLARGAKGRSLLRQLALLVAGFSILFGGVWSFFFARAGSTALIHDAPVFLLHIPETTSAHVGWAGLRAWRTGVWNLLYSACVWLGIFVAVEIVALRREDPARARRRFRLLGAALLAALLLAAMGAVPGPVFFSAAPLICVAALVVGWRGAGVPSSRALMGFGWMGLVASHRRFFFIDDAPYVAPPLLFAFVCAAGLTYHAIEREASPVVRRKLSGAFAIVLGLLLLAAFAGRTISYASDDRIPIRGTENMLSARPETARQIEAVAEEIRRETGAGEGLVVFPEGEIFNYLAGRSNPIRHKLYLPGYLTPENEGKVVEELRRRPPAAVVIWPRPLADYGPALFGDDFGLQARDWIRKNYRERSFGPSGRHPILAMRKRP